MTLVSTIALKDHTTYSKDAIQQQLKQDWGYVLADNKFTPASQKDSPHSLVINFDTLMVGITFFDSAFPYSNVENACKSAWYWKDASKSFKVHQSHIIISIIGQSDRITEHLLLTKVTASLLRVTNPIGVSFGMGGIVNSPQAFLDDSYAINEDRLPLFLWIYFGLQKDGKGYLIFSSGMEIFSKKDVEIIHTQEPPNDAFLFLYNICHYVLRTDATLKEGDSIPYNDKRHVELEICQSYISPAQDVIRIDL